LAVSILSSLVRRSRTPASPQCRNTRALAEAKTQAVAEGLAEAEESPGKLRRALLDANSWFSITASWVGVALGDILKSEAAQKTIGAVTEASTRAGTRHAVPGG
jgi:hypothetical protein